MRVIFASNNKGKVVELQALLKNSKMSLIPQQELGVRDIHETGLTFVENAILKARHACKETGLPAIADDSGLEIRALKGEPGIYSARYAGDKASTYDNIKKVLSAMRDVPETEREACFHCVLVYLAHENDPSPIICHGIWKGRILSEPKGTHGFGYDPIFFDENEKKSAAELSPEVKNRISHRALALKQLLLLLQDKLCKH